MIKAFQFSSKRESGSESLTYKKSKCLLQKKKNDSATLPSQPCLGASKNPPIKTVFATAECMLQK